MNDTNLLESHNAIIDTIDEDNFGDPTTGPIEDDEATTDDQPEADSPGSTWAPSASLLAKLGELISTRHEVEAIRAQKKASAAAYADREKALDARISDLTEQINEETWSEVFDPENGIVHRTNLLTGETETRPYEPPPQVELPFVEHVSDTRDDGPQVGLYGEDDNGDSYVVEKVDGDEFVVAYYDDAVYRLETSVWEEYAPRPDVDQQDYRDTFEGRQAKWSVEVLENVNQMGMSLAQIRESLFLPLRDEPRIIRALQRLQASGSIKTEGLHGTTVYLLHDGEADEEPTPAPTTTSILPYVTDQWEGIREIAARAGIDSKVAAKEAKKLLVDGAIEAEGQKRGRKYRRAQ